MSIFIKPLKLFVILSVVLLITFFAASLIYKKNEKVSAMSRQSIFDMVSISDMLKLYYQKQHKYPNLTELKNLIKDNIKSDGSVRSQHLRHDFTDSWGDEFCYGDVPNSTAKYLYSLNTVSFEDNTLLIVMYFNQGIISRGSTRLKKRSQCQPVEVMHPLSTK